MQGYEQTSLCAPPILRNRSCYSNHGFASHTQTALGSSLSRNWRASAEMGGVERKEKNATALRGKAAATWQCQWPTEAECFDACHLYLFLKLKFKKTQCPRTWPTLAWNTATFWRPPIQHRRVIQLKSQYAPRALPLTTYRSPSSC